MTGLTFTAERGFPRWLGPFSPARGNKSGFRFHDRRLGTFVASDEGSAFWAVVESAGARALAHLVREEWGGGRVLLLPDGLVIKPLNRDAEVGRRVLVGSIEGAVVLERPEGGTFDLGDPGRLAAGARWLGPTTTGLECAIQPDGSLRCGWYHPTPTGRDEVTAVLRGPSAALAAGFRKARPGDGGGRVRVTANGHVITNRQESNDAWVALYVGRVDVAKWPRRKEWIGRGAS